MLMTDRARSASECRSAPPAPSRSIVLDSRRLLRPLSALRADRPRQAAQVISAMGARERVSLDPQRRHDREKQGSRQDCDRRPAPQHPPTRRVRRSTAAPAPHERRGNAKEVRRAIPTKAAVVACRRARDCQPNSVTRPCLREAEPRRHRAQPRGDDAGEHQPTPASCLLLVPAHAGCRYAWGIGRLPNAGRAMSRAAGTRPRRSRERIDDLQSGDGRSGNIFGVQACDACIQTRGEEKRIPELHP